MPLREAINRAEGNWGPQLFIGMWQIQCAKTSLEQLFGCVLNCSQLGGHSSTFLLMLQSIHSYTNSYKITLTCLDLNDVWWCAQNLNLGPQDGRQRRIHWVMFALCQYFASIGSSHNGRQNVLQYWSLTKENKRRNKTNFDAKILNLF